MFHALGMTPNAGVAAFLAPTLPELPVLLLGAQVAGIASSLNYLLSQEAIFDLLNAQQATILVIPSRGLDAMCWSKAQGALEDVPTLRHVVVIGGDTEGLAGFVRLEDAIGSFRTRRCPRLPAGSGSNRRVRPVPYRRHDGTPEARPPHARQPDSCRLRVWPSLRLRRTRRRHQRLSVLPCGRDDDGRVVGARRGRVRHRAVALRIAPAIRRRRLLGHRAAFQGNRGERGPDFDRGAYEFMESRDGRIFRENGRHRRRRLPKAIGSRFAATTGIQLFETYGMTETAAAIAFNPGRGEAVAGSVGFRPPYSEIRIRRLDPARPGLCQPDESGLVEVRGPQVFPGYIDPAHNQGTLEPDGWLATGDIGYLTQDARLVLTGREKDLIVRSGHNIDPPRSRMSPITWKASTSARRSVCDQYAVRYRRCLWSRHSALNPTSTAWSYRRAYPRSGGQTQSIKIIDTLP
jgi:fatty-acyl-CoA synthase